MKYFLNPSYETKPNEEKIKFLESIKDDIDKEIKEIKKEIINKKKKEIEDRLKMALQNIIDYDNNDLNINNDKINKAINRLSLKKYHITKELYCTLELYLSLTLSENKYDIYIEEKSINTGQKIINNKNVKIEWTCNNTVINIKKYKNLRVLNEYLINVINDSVYSLLFL